VLKLKYSRSSPEKSGRGLAYDDKKEQLQFSQIQKNGGERRIKRVLTVVLLTARGGIMGE